ncbi:MAG: PCRF domain-containing protein [Pirellulaceae bacterium]|nr:PCRF domain-containing protein [Pirellulaceae bacterium]
MRTIAKRELGRVLLRSGITRRRLRVDVDRGVIDQLAKQGYKPAFGARPMKRAVEQLALLPLARKLAEMGSDRRPALLRLLPGDKNVRLQVIHDRQSRRNERMTRPKVVDPVSGKTKTVRPREIREQVDGLHGSLDRLVDEFDRRSLAARRSELVSASCGVDFWDDRTRSRHDLSELYRLERLITARDELNVQINAVAGDCDLLEDRSAPHLWTEIADRSAELQRQTELLEYSVRCEHKVDRCDAFLVIESAYASALPYIRQLVEMYEAWARRMGFDVTLVHEQRNREGTETGEVVMMIEGNAVYGVMQCEHGLHEFQLGKKENEFVLVRVMPVDESDAADQSDIIVDSKPSNDRGSIIGDFSFVTTASRTGSEKTVRIENALSKEDAISMAKDLLVSEANRQENNASSSGKGDEEIAIARRYRLASNASARDPRTGATVDKLNDLWKGHLNPFFLAWLDH